ncbi:hypothetical protein ACQZV8_00585 [Magnetococcales bacterium HHB-1]
MRCVLCEAVFIGGANFFKQQFKLEDQALVERLTRRNMRLQKYGQTRWKDEPILT